MMRYGVSAERALDLLVRWSNADNIKVHSLAEMLVDVALSDPSMRRAGYAWDFLPSNPSEGRGDFAALPSTT